MLKVPPPFLAPYLRLIMLTMMMRAAVLATPDESERDTEQAPLAPAAPIMLDAYTIEETPPKLSFGVSLSLWKDAHTGLVKAMYIDKVKSDSSAEEHGFGPRTRIYRIDGKPVEEMKATFNGDSELNKIFINRKVGSKIVVEAIPEGAFASKTVTLVEKVSVNVKIRVWD